MDLQVIPQIYASLSYFLSQSAFFVLKLVVAYIIWLLGKWIINSLIGLIEKADIKDIKLDDQIRNTLIKIARPTAKAVLILVVLDYLGIGSNIIGAVAQGITFTIAIALGISFGEAFKPEAKKIVDQLKNKADIA